MFQLMSWGQSRGRRVARAPDGCIGGRAWPLAPAHLRLHPAAWRKRTPRSSSPALRHAGRGDPRVADLTNAWPHATLRADSALAETFERDLHYDYLFEELLLEGRQVLKGRK